MNNVSILIPDLPKPVADTIVAAWHKRPGGAIVYDEALVEVEADKAVLGVPASADDILGMVLEDEGTTITSRQIFDRLRGGNNAGRETSAKSKKKVSTPAQRQQVFLEEQDNDALSPVIRRLLAEHNLDTSAVKGAGVGSRLTRGDVEEHSARAPTKEFVSAAPAPAARPVLATRNEERMPMTRLYRRVAKRLLEVGSSTAILTTFDEVDIKPIMDLRKQYGGTFERHHGIRLDLMSFYVKAVVGTLKRYPGVNASIGGDNMVYHNRSNASVAVSMPRGLVTPVLHDVDTFDMADIERKVKELAVRDRGDKLTVEDLTGGNLTTTNGDVFGPLMLTPVINPPQSAILGMHAIKDRPMTASDQVKILPMMYLTLFYDHRLIDDRGSMSLPVVTKELLEDSTHLLLGVQQFKPHLHCRPMWIGCRSTT